MAFNLKCNFPRIEIIPDNLKSKCESTTEINSSDTFNHGLEKLMIDGPPNIFDDTGDSPISCSYAIRQEEGMIIKNT